MTSARHLSNKRLVILVGYIVLYLGLWFLTHQVGAPQIRTIAFEAMHVPPNSTSSCSSHAYAPFVIRVDYGWHGAPLCGDGGSALYLWFFGRAVLIRELEHWAE